MGAFVILTASAAAWAADEARDGGEAPTRSRVSVSGLLAGRYEAVWNVNPALDGPLDRNESTPLAYLTTTLSVRPTDALQTVVTLASRNVSRDTLDDGTLEDRWGTTRFIDEAWVKAGGDAVWLKVGKQRLIVGRGLVLDSYQPAISANADAPPAGDASLQLKAFGTRLDEDGALRRGQSLYAGGRIDISHPLAGRLSISISRLWDRNALIPTLLPTNVSLGLRDAPFHADDGSLVYWIVDGAAAGGRWSVDALAVTETGSLGGVLNTPLIPVPARRRSITLFGKAAEIRAAYEVSDRLTVRAVGLYTSGDRRGPIDALRDQRYEAFVGIFPLVDTTNLFFRGGIDSAFKAGSPTASGVLGRGVLAGALTAEATIDRLALRVVAADLWSEFPATGGSERHYGVEIDTEWAYAVTEWLTARLEGDVLVPGSFYRSALDPNPEPVYKLAAGVDAAW